jgi:hypothetical protein
LVTLVNNGFYEDGEKEKRENALSFSLFSLLWWDIKGFIGDSVLPAAPLP